VDSGYADEDPASPPAGPVTRQRDLPARIERSYILLMDVLEHLDDDLGMLREIRERCHGANRYFITVPAFQGVWSYHDVQLGHKRRYTRTTLRGLLDGAGFRIERIYYIYGLLFPLVWAYRRLRPHAAPRSDKGPVHPFANRLLRDVITAEMRWVGSNRLFGLTCVAEGVCEGPGAGPENP
jgi:hypothetical protein